MMNELYSYYEYLFNWRIAQESRGGAGKFCRKMDGPHFPTQKREKIRSTISSRAVRPVSSPMASRASSASARTASGVRPLSRAPRPRLWFALAAVVCGAFLVALDRTVAKGLPYVPMLPMYPILFLDFLASGCYTWWRRRRKLK